MDADGRRDFRGTPTECAACHADAHRGFFAEVADAGATDLAQGCGRCHLPTRFDEHREEAFDHGRWTAFALDGAHARAACTSCHASSDAPDAAGRRFGFVHERFGEPTGDCATCHGDPHDGAFDAEALAHAPGLRRVEGRTGCARCHLTESFRDPALAAFDHGAWTGFALDGAHARAGCTSCHARSPQPDALGRTFGRVREHFGEPASACATCHADAHRGAFASAALPAQVAGRAGCARCHTTAAFRQLTDEPFDDPGWHANWTGYPLADFHADLACKSCHARLPAPGLPDESDRRFGFVRGTACSDCHADPHVGQFADRGATDCAACHRDDGLLTFDHDRDARFALDEQHDRLDCSACHTAWPLADGTTGRSVQAPRYAVCRLPRPGRPERRGRRPMSRRPLPLVVAALALALCAVPARALGADDFERVEAFVSAVSGDGTYIDQGREAWIRAGDTVFLEPVGRPAVEGRVLVVSRTSARIHVLGASDGIEIGTRVEVLVPAERCAAEEAEPPQASAVQDPAPEPAAPASRGDESGAAAEPADPAPPARTEPAPSVPEHPEWSHPPLEWQAEVPLLAPVYGLEPEDRDVRLRGRVYTLFELRDSGEPVDQRYLTSRTGVDVTAENPFGRGGELGADLDYHVRSADGDEGTDEEDAFLTVNRLYYRWGGLRGRPHRVQAGRFQQHEFPELGILDGVEYGYRFDSGSRLGASVGLLPEFRDELSTGDDVQAAFFYRYAAGEDERFSAGLGYQKTWHGGEADRDLLLANARWTGRRAYLQTTAWVDYYDASEDFKSEGLELTRLHVNANVRSESGGSGVGAFLSYFRFAETLRDDLVDLDPSQFDDDPTTRVGLNGWVSPAEKVRLRSRFDLWQDEDDEGGSANLTLSTRDLLYDRGNVDLTVFGSEGKFSDGLGLRTSASRRVGQGLVRLTWSLTNYEQEDFSGAQQDILQSRLRASWETSFRKNWSLSLWAENDLGDDLEAITAGVLLQRVF